MAPDLVLAPALGDVAHQLLDDVGEDGFGQAGLTTHGAADGIGDLRRLRSLDQVAHRAGVEHLHHAGAIFVGREGDHPCIGERPPHLAGHPRSAAAGHLHVHQRDVRPGGVAALDRLVRVGRRPDELEVGLVLDQGTEGVTQWLLVLRDHYADR